MTQSSTTPVEIKLPVPSRRQLEWHKMEYYAFVHFGPNTFSGQEWGDGREDPQIFNPTQLDCRQWVQTFKKAGMKGVIITAKHHDGFCLWPSKYSSHTVAASPWKSGKGDVLRELSNACKAEGLKMGVYLSPWDRNHPTYGTPEYNQVFAKMLTEVLTSYGPMFEVWFDGANGEGPNGKKQVYDWNLFINTVRKHQPNAVIFSDAGPDVRWVGNESGIASETNWNTLNRDRFVPGTPHYKELGEGHRNGTHWVPAECDVSIRPGWFYRAAEDDKVKTPEQLLDIYMKSVGRGSNLLLNVPPDTRGLIHAKDQEALFGLKHILDKMFRKDLQWGFGAHLNAEYEPVTRRASDVFDRIVLAEDISLGQRVEEFEIEVNYGFEWEKLAEGTTIGSKRIVPTRPVRGDAVRLKFLKTAGEPRVKFEGIYASSELQEGKVETIQQHNARMQWWREARFGMFIHWGLYAIPAGQWGSATNHGEWIRETAKISIEEYNKLQPQFNPTNFNAREWAKMAKDAGMKYVVITSKHHDGFGLWPSNFTSWDIEGTPFKRDILKELAEAVRAEGLKMCFYHSIMDWHHPDYLPRRSWEGEMRPADGANMDRYVEYMRSQLTELLTKYGDIGVVWFDGEWESTWNDKYGKPLYDLCRKLQPNIIVNNRVSNARGGSMTFDGNEPNRIGDFSTPEQYIPATGLPGIDWETCMTMNNNWGYNKNDKNWKSSSMLIRNLIDVASKGGNYLLNIGPMANGEFPPESVERLADIGKWMKVNGESIYGTQASVFDALPWGRCTMRNDGRAYTDLYLHVFDWPKDGKLVVPGLGNEILEARLLGGGRLEAKRVGANLEIAVPPQPLNEIATVIEVELIGRPIVYRTPKITAPSAMLVRSLPVTIEGGSQDLEVRYTTDGSEPSPSSLLYSKPFAVSKTTTVKASAFHKGKQVSGTASTTFRQVTPDPSMHVEGVVQGLKMSEFAGSFDKMPDFGSLVPRASSVATSISLDKTDENVARVYNGYILVPSDDVYSFALTSDDGSMLWVDGKVAVDNDGLHGSETKTGTVALAKGLHKIRIGWFNKSGSAALDLKWGALGSALKPASADVLRYEREE